MAKKISLSDEYVDSVVAVADAIRKVTAKMQDALAEGQRSSRLDAFDLIEAMLAVADELDPIVPASAAAYTPAGDDYDWELELVKVRKAASGGTWVTGWLETPVGNRHLNFDALVFPEHAEQASFELNDSRISKLALVDQAHHALYNFDRGLDVDSDDPIVLAAVDFLSCGLAESVFGDVADDADCSPSGPVS